MHHPTSINDLTINPKIISNIIQHLWKVKDSDLQISFKPRAKSKFLTHWLSKIKSLVLILSLTLTKSFFVMLSHTMSSHTTILSSHTTILSSHTTLLSSHTTILSSHTTILSSHTWSHSIKLSYTMSRSIMSLSKQLSSHTTS